MARIAVLQMTSGIEPEANFRTIADSLAEARDKGAAMLFTPEMSLLLDRDRARGARHIEGQDWLEFPQRLADCAEDAGVTLALGSMQWPAGDGKAFNRSMLFPADGGDPVIYDKMHLFDVDLASGESWRESNAYRAGEAVVTAEGTPVGRLGLTICYDIRFPALFDSLGRAGCDALAIPAAFTVPTGKAHWHVLQRARAIEASAFVVAAAQVGRHEDGRTTFGHSLVVDPWGEVLLDMGGEAPGLGFVDIDLAQVSKVRSQVPSLANRRPMPN